MNRYIKGFLCNVATLAEYIKLAYRYDKDGQYKNIHALMRKSDRQVHRLMKRAYQIPFYRKKFEACGLRPDDFHCRADLMKFPVTTKTQLREWMEQECSKAAAANGFINRTSGSAGIPLKMLYSIHDKAVANANWIRILKIHGYHPLTDCTMAVKINSSGRGGLQDSLIQKCGMFRRYTYSALMEMPDLAEALNTKKPVLFYANKSVLVRLVLYAKNHQIQLYKPRLICSTSEHLDAPARKLITGYFGHVLFESYGAEEVSAFTYTLCSDPDRHYVTWDTHTFFTRKADGSCCPDASGEMVVTSLYQRKYPVINYELKDEAEVFSEDGIPYIKKVCGRRTDWFFFEDGERLGFQPFYILAEDCPYCDQMRFIQLDHWNIKIQLVKNEALVSVRQAEEELARKLDSLIRKKNIKYQFEWLDEILPDQNQKLKFMVSNLAEPHASAAEKTEIRN